MTTSKEIAVYAMFAVVFLSGCAVHKLPKIGAPPTWKPDAPFGGHWDCHNDHYQYNPQTMKCELKP